MARGWESKGIEAQQEEAQRNQRPRAPLTPAQRASEERRRTLQLTRARAADDLNRARSTPHRQLLEQTIAAIDAQLEAL